jgi:hypothetical protein
MKKRTKVAISLLAIIIIYVFFQYESIESTPNVIGCYTSEFNDFNDHVCLYKTGEFEQFQSVKGIKKEKYNTSTWDSFSYSNDEGDFIAVTMKGFVIINPNKETESVMDMDIQPRKNSFNKTIFRIGKHRVYFLD